MIFCIIALVITTRIKSEWKKEEPVNFTGSILYVISMALIAMGVFDLSGRGAVPLITGVITLGIFIKTERKNENQIFSLKLFKNMNFDIGNFAAFSSNYITYVLTHIITLYLLYIADFEAYICGLILLITPVAMIITSPISGKLTNRFDSRLLCIVAMIFLLITLTMMMSLDVLPFELLIAAMIFQGIGHALFSPANTKNILTTVDDEYVANASAFLSTSKDFGKSISIGIFNTVCAFGLNFDKISDVNSNLLKACDISIITVAILAVIALVLLIYSKTKYGEKMINIFKRFIS